MVIDINKSSMFQEIKEKEEEKYSFYKLYDLVHIILSLMDIFEEEKYHSVGKLGLGNAIIEAYQPMDKTKRIVIDKWLIDYMDLKLDHTHDEDLMYGFGPNDSRFA